MSIVIIGGNECMERDYLNNAKVFCKYKSCMKDRIGNPDLMILFTHTVSHKMVKIALDSAGTDTQIVRTHTSSKASLKSILSTYAQA